MSDNSKKTYKLALGGILGALTVICLFLATVSPTGRLSLYALSSFFISIVIIETGIKAGWLFYIATVLLSAILVPEKLEIVPYAIFFGIYGIIKYYIEKINRAVLEYVLKYLYFNICMAAAVLVIKEFLMEGIKVQLPWWIIITVFEVVFIIYDMVYTRFIAYYADRIRPRLRIG